MISAKRKITLPVVLSYRRGSKEERNFWKRTLEDGNQTADDLVYAQKLMERHGAIADTIERASHYGDIARDALAIFPDSALEGGAAGGRRFLRGAGVLRKAGTGAPEGAGPVTVDSADARQYEYGLMH